MTTKAVCCWTTGRIRLAVALASSALCACSGSSQHLQKNAGPHGAIGATSINAPPPGRAISVTVGEQRTVLPRGALGLSYFPDMAVIPIAGEPTFTLLVTATISTYRVTGGDLFSLTSATKVLSPGARGEFDNGYTGISGVYKDPGGKLYGFYHAEDQEGMPLIPGTQIPGFYARIAVASSGDAGRTWQKLGPVISSAKPKDYIAYEGQADRGAAEPGVLVDADRRYLYLYYGDHARVGGRGVQISVARADLGAGPPLPGAFRKYHDGTFSEPGIGGMDDAVISGRRLDAADAMMPHPVRSAYLDCYVMIFNIDVYREWQGGRPAAQSGFYVAYSNDAIHWSDPKPLFVDNTVPVNGRSLSWQGSLLWEDATEKSGWLVYGYSERWPKSHYMVARELDFERAR